MSLISNLNEPTGYQEGAAKQCKPNFQEEAASLKKRLEITKEFNRALMDYTLGPMPYELKGKEFNIYELKGFLEFEIIRGNKTYNGLLELIEKEKADGSK